MRAARLFLLAAILCLAAGVLLVTEIITTGRVVVAYFLFPVGGVLFGMFLLWRALEKEGVHPEPGNPDAAGAASVGNCACGGDCGCHSKDSN